MKEFKGLAFSYAGLDWKKYVVLDERFYRPAEDHALREDCSKAKRKLGWKPKIKFKELAKMMEKADLKNEERLCRSVGK